MDFYKKYELLAMVRGDHIRVFTGREIASGRMVQVHLFTAGKTPETASVLDRVRQIPPAYHSAVIEVGEHEGTPYLVTILPPGAETLEAWLDRVAPRARRDAPAQARVYQIPAGPAQAGGAVRPTAPGDEEFAKLFGNIAPPAPPPALLGEIPTRGLPVAPPPPPPAQRPPATSPPPGDFTRQFQASAPPPPPPSAAPAADFRNLIITPERSAPPPAAPPAPRQPSAGPGEFTRMFQAPAAGGPAPAAPAPAPPAAPRPQQGGEFTRMFQAPAAGGPAPAASAPAPPAAPKPQHAGEFTRMFQAPSTGAPAPAASAPAPRPAGAGEFTSFFQSPLTPTPLRETGSRADPFAGRPQPPPPGRALNAPGEFTRMFGKDDIPGRKTPLAPAGPPMPAPMAGGSVTQAFATPAAPPAPLPGMPPPDMQQSGPSEFTRMFKAPAAPAEAAPGPGGTPPPQAAPAAFAAPPKTSKLPLILGLGGLVLVIVFLVLFFALKK